MSLISPDIEAEPLRILQWYLLRCQVEGAFEEVTVQTCGDLPTIGPIVEGQPSTVFPLQTVSVPSNVNSYLRSCGLTWAWKPSASGRIEPSRGPRPLSGLFSVVTLAVDVLVGQQGGMAPRATAWYDKTSPSFADAIALVRRYLWVERVTFMTSEREPESIKVPHLLYHRMLDTLAYAA